MNRLASVWRRWASILVSLAVFGLVSLTVTTIHNQAERIKIVGKYMDRAYIHVLRTAGFDEFTSSMERLAARELDDQARLAELRYAADRWDQVAQSLAVMVTLKDDGNPKGQRVWWQNYDISIPYDSSVFRQIADASLLPFTLRETAKKAVWGKAEGDLCTAVVEQARQIPVILLTGRSNSQDVEPAHGDDLDLILPQLTEINRLTRAYRPTALMPR